MTSTMPAPRVCPQERVPLKNGAEAPDGRRFMATVMEVQRCILTRATYIRCAFRGQRRFPGISFDRLPSKWRLVDQMVASTHVV